MKTEMFIQMDGVGSSPDEDEGEDEDGKPP